MNNNFMALKVGLQGIQRRGERLTVILYVFIIYVCVCVCIYKQFFIIKKCEGDGDGEEQVMNGQV